VYYIHNDHIQTPRVVTDRSSNLRWTWLAEPFGTTAPNTNPAGLGALTFNLRHPGQFADAESGLFYNYFRDYDSTSGRYVQSDPIGLAGGINTYAYVGGNPLRYIDPNGQFAIPAIIPLLPIIPIACYLTEGCRNWWNNLWQPDWSPMAEPMYAGKSKYDKAAEGCYEECQHLLCDKDLQASPYRKCFRQCMYRKGFGGLPPD
jgi:RHS repeat-associated protein